jgi:hypothetical protein
MVSGSPKKNTPACASDLQASDFIFTVFLSWWRLEITYSVFLGMGIFVDFLLCGIIIKITTEHSEL